MSVAVKLSKYAVITANEVLGDVIHTLWAVDAQDAVEKTKELYKDEEIMDVYKAVKGWKK